MNTVLYIGVSNNIIRRVFEHKNNMIYGFTTKYNVHKLVYYEIYDDIAEAIKREKQLKSGSRQKKIDLIEKLNPAYIDLYNSIVA